MSPDLTEDVSLKPLNDLIDKIAKKPFENRCVALNETYCVSEPSWSSGGGCKQDG